MGLLSVLLLAGLCGCHGGAVRAHVGVRLRVLTYNIHHGEGVDGKLDLKRIAQVITSVDPDLVALQEVDRGTRRTQEIDQPAELAQLTKMHVVFGGNIRYQGGDLHARVVRR